MKQIVVIQYSRAIKWMWSVWWKNEIWLLIADFKSGDVCEISVFFSEKQEAFQQIFPFLLNWFQKHLTCVFRRSSHPLVALWERVSVCKRGTLFFGEHFKVLFGIESRWAPLWASWSNCCCKPQICKCPAIVGFVSLNSCNCCTVMSRIKAPVYLLLNRMKESDGEQHLRHQPCIR